MKKYILILFSVFSFGQSGLIARQNFAYKAVSTGTNTEIGGVAATISTPALLATKLGISVGNISNFSIAGSAIKCKITGSYAIPNGAFVSDTSITYYDDIGGLVTYLSGNECFKNANNIKYIYLPNVTSIAGSGHFSFNANSVLQYIYIPRCALLGATVGNDFIFSNTNAVCKVYVPVSLQTNNGGNPDGDISAADINISFRYVTNFTAPNQVTDLAAGIIYNTAIQLNFTPPSSTNAIDYYELHKNGIFEKRIVSGDYATGLTASTNYNFTIYAVDIFMNKSLVSNTLNVSTNTTPVIDNTKVIAAYHLLSDGVDSKNGYNGTVGSSVTFSSGAIFNNTTNSYISVADNNDFSFTNGSGTDKPFSISFFVTFNDLTNQWIVSKRGGTSGSDEYQLVLFGSKIYMQMFSSNNASYIEIVTSNNLNSATLYNIILTYSGNNSHTGLKLYINSVLQSASKTTYGTYTGMVNGTQPVGIGKLLYNDVLRLNGKLKELNFFNTELTATEVLLLQNSTYPF